MLLMITPAKPRGKAVVAAARTSAYFPPCLVKEKEKKTSRRKVTKQYVINKRNGTHPVCCSMGTGFLLAPDGQRTGFGPEKVEPEHSWNPDM